MDIIMNIYFNVYILNMILLKQQKRLISIKAFIQVMFMLSCIKESRLDMHSIPKVLKNVLAI